MGDRPRASAPAVPCLPAPAARRRANGVDWHRAAFPHPFRSCRFARRGARPPPLDRLLAGVAGVHAVPHDRSHAGRSGGTAGLRRPARRGLYRRRLLCRRGDLHPRRGRRTSLPGRSVATLRRPDRRYPSRRTTSRRTTRRRRRSGRIHRAGGRSPPRRPARLLPARLRDAGHRVRDAAHGRSAAVPHARRRPAAAGCGRSASARRVRAIPAHDTRTARHRLTRGVHRFFRLHAISRHPFAPSPRCCRTSRSAGRIAPPRPFRTVGDGGVLFSPERSADRARSGPCPRLEPSC